MKSKRWLLAVGAVLLLVAGATLTACGSGTQPATGVSAQPDSATGQAQGEPALSAVPLGEGEQLRAVATTSIVADVVSNVGGDRIALTRLLPFGADPHGYQPTPADLRAVADAHVIFANGLGLEGFLDEMIQNAGGDTPVIYVSDGIQVRELGGVHEEADGEGASAGDQPSSADPHTWFDPNNVIIWTQNVEHALSKLDPANTEVYKANADAYVAELETLDAWIREQVAQIPEDRRKLVTDHRTLGYFADEYGFEQIGAVVEGYSTLAEPSSRELAALEDDIRKYAVPAVFVGKTVNPKLAERVAEDTGIQLVPLYTGSLSEPGGDAATYIDFMHYDVSTIVSALKS